MSNLRLEVDSNSSFCNGEQSMLNTPIIKFIHSIGIGAIGAILLLLFGTMIVPGERLLGLLPIIVGFNGLVTGYSLIDKTKGQIRAKYLWLAAAGLLFVLPIYFVVNTTTLVVFEVQPSQLVKLLIIGVAGVTAGGWLSNRYLQIKASKKDN